MTAPSPAPDSPPIPHRLVLVLALVLTALNAAVPVTVDDPAYLRQSSWWAAHPFDPLGGETLLYQTMVPAAANAAPPVGVAWLALGMCMFGDTPPALKLWLFPWAWLFVWAVSGVVARASPVLRGPLIALAVLSPATVPSFHFMLDLPALALGLTAFGLLTGPDPSRRTAVVAGLLAGLALQTKYSAIGVVAAGFLAVALAGRVRLAVAGGAIAVATFTVIEALFSGGATPPLIAYLASRPARDPDGHFPLVTARKLVLMAGTAGAALIPLGLFALGARRLWGWVSVVAVLGGWILLALAPNALVAWLDHVTGGRGINHANLTIGWMGPALALIIILAGTRAWRSGDPFARALTVWLILECAIAPFVSASASVRRVLGALVALTILLSWHAARSVARDPVRRTGVLATLACGILLTLGFVLVDRDSALSEQRALARARERIHGNAGRIAYVADHWGAFQDAARRAGLIEVSAERAPLVPGDWLLVPFGVEMRHVALDPAHVALVDSVPLPHRLPLTTHRSYYDGRQALQRVDPAWVGAHLYRVTAVGIALRPISSR